MELLFEIWSKDTAEFGDYLCPFFLSSKISGPNFVPTQGILQPRPHGPGPSGYFRIGGCICLHSTEEQPPFWKIPRKPCAQSPARYFENTQKNYQVRMPRRPFQELAPVFQAVTRLGYLYGDDIGTWERGCSMPPRANFFFQPGSLHIQFCAPSKALRHAK